MMNAKAGRSLAGSKSRDNLHESSASGHLASDGGLLTFEKVLSQTAKLLVENTIQTTEALDKLRDDLQGAIELGKPMDDIIN